MATIELKSTGRIFCFLALLTVGACTSAHSPLKDFEALEPTTLMDAPAPDKRLSGSYDARQVKHGRYLVEMLTCGSCHTNGALIGEPDSDKQLAGSHIGIAWSNPLENKYPGVVYPSNLTADPETGIGSWSDDEVLEMVRYGIDRHGRQQLSVMPWPAYTKLTDEDAESIVAYLRTLAAVQHRVPDNVNPGTRAKAPYVHFGVYRSR